MDYIVLYLILINAVSFVLILVDKYSAQNKLSRIPEAVLLTVVAIGGSFGCFIAMRLVRHKTRHEKFFIGVPVMMVLHILIIWDICRNL